MGDERIESRRRVHARDRSGLPAEGGYNAAVAERWMRFIGVGRLVSGIAMALAVTGCGGSGQPAPASQVEVLTGPRFWTGIPARPWADALVVDGGKIERLLDHAELGQLVAAGAAVRRLPGALAVPGLVDAHGHLTSYAMTARRAGLTGARTVDEALERVRAFAEAHPDDAWILGRGWDQNDWPGRAWPDAERLEQVVPGRPVALTRIDGHAMWVNRTALAAAGIDAATPDPPGGKIHRDDAGRPTGILIDRAEELVQEVIPPPSPQIVEQALADAVPKLLAMGLTGVHDMDTDALGYGGGWREMRALAAAGKFPLRVNAYASTDSTLFRELLERGPQTDGRLRAIGVKLYLDGALGSRGARLLAPYADDRGNIGLWLTEPSAVASHVRQARAAGLQTAIHAIGDAANRAALDIYEQEGRGAVRPGDVLRPRIEHVQVIAPADLPRFRELGVIASMQPTHATSDMPWAEDRLGAERIAGAYAWRSLLDAGSPLAFGSDFPIESPDPRLGLYAAVTRQDLNGMPPGGWRPEERLTLQQALAAFAAGAAYAAGQEADLGTLGPGRWADMTIFEENLFELPAAVLPTAAVAATVIEGETVYSK